MQEFDGGGHLSTFKLFTQGRPPQYYAEDDPDSDSTICFKDFIPTRHLSVVMKGHIFYPVSLFTYRLFKLSY